MSVESSNLLDEEELLGMADGLAAVWCDPQKDIKLKKSC